MEAVMNAPVSGQKPSKVLIGKESQVVDGRFRIRLPLNLCDPDVRELVVSLGLHGKWIEILPKWTYEAYYSQLWPKASLESSLGFINYSDRDFVDNLRDVLESHHKTMLDDSQRVVIPQDLREDLGINAGDTVVLIGKLDHVEVWRQEDYVSYKQTRRNQDPSLVFKSHGLGAGGKGGDTGSEFLSKPEGS